MQIHCPNSHRQTGRQTYTCGPIPALLHADALSQPPQTHACIASRIVPIPRDTCIPALNHADALSQPPQTHISLHRIMQVHCPNPHRHIYPCIESCRCIVPTPTDTYIPASNHAGALSQPPQTHISLHRIIQVHCPNPYRHMCPCTESCRCIVPTPTDTYIPASNHAGALSQPLQTHVSLH